VRFVIHAKDKPDSLAIRQATRPAHLDYMSGFEILVGGPLLDPDGQMCGSCIVLEAESLEAAEAFAAGDPYRAAGLFESVSIHEFKTVTWPT
jgi:uncharacterized protein YciI